MGNHRLSVIAIVLLARGTMGANAQRYFMCMFGPDSAGAYVQEVVPEPLAKGCGQFCVCQDLKTTCLLGPDSLCNYATTEVDRSFADTCDRSACTCTSHVDYMSVANNRLSSSSYCLSQM